MWFLPGTCIVFAIHLILSDQYLRSWSLRSFLTGTMKDTSVGCEVCCSQQCIDQHGSQSPSVIALRVQYQQRRDAFIDALADAFQLDMGIEINGHRKGSLVYHASLKPERQFSEKSSMRYSKPLFSFVPPSSGMFVWVCTSTFRSTPVLIRLRVVETSPRGTSVIHGGRLQGVGVQALDCDGGARHLVRFR